MKEKEEMKGKGRQDAYQDRTKNQKKERKKTINILSVGGRKRDRCYVRRWFFVGRRIT